VLAQVGFQVSSAYGRHDHMIVRHVLYVNHGPRRCPEIAGLAEPGCAGPGLRRRRCSALTPHPTPMAWIQNSQGSTYAGEPLPTSLRPA
jgi:hypothetical protein